MNKKFLVLPLLTAAMLCAQGPRGFGRAAASTTPPTPAQIAQNDVNRLTKLLTLTPPQQTTILGILTTAITSLQANASALQTGRASLVAAIKANTAATNAATDATIESILIQMSPLQEKQDVIRYEAAAAVWAQLTSTQQALVTNVMSLFGGGGPGFRGMRPAGPPPAPATTTP